MASEKKSKSTAFVMGLVILLLVVVFIIAVSNGITDEPQGVLLLAALAFFIVTGAIRAFKVARDGSSPSSMQTVGRTSPIGQDGAGTSAGAPGPSSATTAASSPATALAVPMTASPAPDVQASSGTTLAQRFASMPVPRRVAFGVAAVLLIVLVIFGVSSIFVGPPTGTWVLEGHEERIRYEFYEDKTWEMFDHGELVESGYYTQFGNRVECHVLYDHGIDREDGFTTVHFVIRGDEMTTGSNTLNRIAE